MRSSNSNSGGNSPAQRVGLGVECSGLVVDGGQISDVEQEGEEELRKKREKGGSLAGTIWAVGDVT